MSSSNSTDDLSRPPSSVDHCDGDVGSGIAPNHIAADHRRAGSVSPTAAASRGGHLDDVDRAAQAASHTAKTDGK